MEHVRDQAAYSQQHMPAFTATEDASIRKTLRRWKSKWNNASSAASVKSGHSAPGTRPSSRASRAPPPVPPMPAPRFRPSTITHIHSPADPRHRTRSHGVSSSSTFGSKPRYLARRQTGLSEDRNPATPFDDDFPLNMVTTTIVAGNMEARRKRASRFRLSISKPGSMLPQPGSKDSPKGRLSHEISSTKIAQRISPVREMARSRADSGREGLMMEAETMKKGEQDIDAGRAKDDAILTARTEPAHAFALAKRSLSVPRTTYSSTGSARSHQRRFQSHGVFTGGLGVFV